MTEDQIYIREGSKPGAKVLEFFIHPRSLYPINSIKNHEKKFYKKGLIVGIFLGLSIGIILNVLTILLLHTNTF